MRATPSTDYNDEAPSPIRKADIIPDQDEWDPPVAPPWALFFVTFITAYFGALIYTFALISEVLTDNGFSPSQIDFLYGFGMLGQYFGIIPGYLHDVVSPLCVAIYAAGAIIIGYSSVISLLAQHLCTSAPVEAEEWSLMYGLDASFGSWLQSAKTPVCPIAMKTAPSAAGLWIMGLGFFIMTQGGAALHYATMPTVLAKFPPLRRGLVSGAIASGYGISAFVLSFLFEHYFSPPEAPGVRPLVLAFFGVVGLIMLLLASATIFCLWPRPKVRASQSSASLYQSPRARASNEDSQSTSQETVVHRRVSFGALELDLPEPKPQTTSLMCHLKSRTFAKHVYVQAVVQGGVASAIGSVALLRQAQLSSKGGSQIWSVARLVRWISLGNFMGRLCSGLLSQCIHHDDYNFFFTQAAALVVVAQAGFLALTPLSNPLFVGCLILVAFAMGVNFTVAPVWVMQTFSPKHVASLHSTAMAAVALSTFVFSYLAGREYEEAGILMMKAGSPPPHSDIVCSGRSCFRWWHTTHLLCSLAAAAVSLCMGRGRVD